MDMDHAAHSHDSGSMVMPVVFQTGISTSLFSEAWTPRTSGQYAGTCIALIAFTIILRALIAFKPRLEAAIWGPYPGRSLVRDEDNEAEKEEHTTQRPGIEHLPHRQGVKGTSPKVVVKLGMAVYEVLIAFLGYLLMLAVMSMNLGYFLSILLGVFLGTLGLGGIARDTTFDHCS